MHYHIFWGLKIAEEPHILSFNDKTEAIDRFISLIKDIEGDAVKDGPPPWKEKVLDDKCTVFQINGEKHKYMLLFCNYESCHKEERKVDSKSLN